LGAWFHVWLRLLGSVDLGRKLRTSR
jgi:hypothetical protein